MKTEKIFKYYNDEEFKKILKLEETKQYLKMMSAYRKYIHQYPNDNSAIVGYSAYLINDGKLEEAEEILSRFSFDHVIDKNIADYYGIYIKLLGCHHRYEECYQLLMEHYDLLKKYLSGFYSKIVFLQKQLGLPIDIDLDEHKYSYEMKQIISYDRELAIDDIIKNSNIDKLVEGKRIFSPNFDIREKFSEVEEKILLSDYPTLYSGSFKNLYIFKYDNCGYISDLEHKTNYFSVYTIQDTNHILTMLPCENFYGYPCIDINPPIQLEESKVKRISQVDKFNQRFGKMVAKN